MLLFPLPTDDIVTGSFLPVELNLLQVLVHTVHKKKRAGSYSQELKSF